MRAGQRIGTRLGMRGKSRAAPPQPPADTQWTERLASPSVFMATRFDTLAEYERGQFPDGFEGVRNIWDTATVSSGNGSLRFEIPPFSGPNSSGQWRRNFADDYANRIQFGEFDEFYFQYRLRLSTGLSAHQFQVTTGAGGWKVIIMAEADRDQLTWEDGSAETSSCVKLHQVVHNGSQRGAPAMYHSCGDYWPYYENVGGVNYIQGAWGDLTLAQQCSTSNALGCFRWADNEWLTCLMKVTIGKLGTEVDRYIGQSRAGFTYSRVEQWWARDGQDYAKVHDAYHNVLQRDGGATQATDEEEYGKFWLTPYHTGKDPNENHSTYYMWFDELIASRTHIHAPGFVPDWLPNVGSVAAVGTNTLSSVDPEDDSGVNPNFPADAPWHGSSGQKSVLDAWNGGVYAADYSGLGALLMHGGGHNAYFGNEVYAFDFDTLAWARVNDPTYPWNLDYTNYELQSGEPMSSHTYDTVQYLPPRLIRTQGLDVGNNKGGFLLMGNSSAHELGGSGANWAWWCNLDTGAWARYSTTQNNTSDRVGYSVFDDRRQMYYLFTSGSNGSYSLDPTTRAWTAETGASLFGVTTASGVRTAALCPDQEVILLMSTTGSFTWIAIDINTGPGNATLHGNIAGQFTGSVPSISNYPGLEWWPRGKCFVYYAGGNTLYFCKPPPRGTDWRTNSWVWSSQTLTGASAPNFVGTNYNGPFSRFRYCDKLDCFAVVGTNTQSVYIFRPDIP